jgi:DNA-binding transcriptional ArsR family regulator/uncharacterized protein YndB with AHSA1/START domain
VETYATAVSALGDPTRRAIFERLRDGPHAVGELARGLPVSRPAVSQHLRVLKEAGLVADEPDGTRRLYRIDPEGLATLRAYVDSFWTVALADFAAEAERRNPMSTSTDLAIRKSVVVSCPPEQAFSLFTEGVAGWWPLATHSVGEEKVRSAVFEAGVGGRIYEIWADGQERDWGEVIVWEPPHRVVYSWQPNEDRPAATEIEVRVTPDGDGARLDLEHRGWERLGGEAAEAYGHYTGGWDVVLSAYVTGAGGE